MTVCWKEHAQQKGLAGSNARIRRNFPQTFPSVSWIRLKKSVADTTPLDSKYLPALNSSSKSTKRWVTISNKEHDHHPSKAGAKTDTQRNTHKQRYDQNQLHRIEPWPIIQSSTSNLRHNWRSPHSPRSQVKLQIFLVYPTNKRMAPYCVVQLDNFMIGILADVESCGNEGVVESRLSNPPDAHQSTSTFRLPQFDLSALMNISFL